MRRRDKSDLVLPDLASAIVVQRPRLFRDRFIATVYGDARDNIFRKRILVSALRNQGRPICENDRRTIGNAIVQHEQIDK